MPRHLCLTLLCAFLSTAIGFHYAMHSHLSSCGSSNSIWMSDAAMSDEANDVADYGKCPGAAKCNGEYREKGCDGTGKIQGGIATYPFFGWWPIKVYRPCPGYQEAGYVYRREGQTLDQVLFSEPSTKMQEKMAALREEKAHTKSDEVKGTQRSNVETDLDLGDEEKKFLEDRFGPN